MEILEEKWEIFLTTRDKILPVSHTKFAQFVQNQNIVKMCLVFPTSQKYQVHVSF